MGHDGIQLESDVSRMCILQSRPMVDQKSHCHPSTEGRGDAGEAEESTVDANEWRHSALAIRIRSDRFVPRKRSFSPDFYKSYLRVEIARNLKISTFEKFG